MIDELKNNIDGLTFDSASAWLMSHVQNNEFMVGLLIAGAASALLYSLRGIPGKVWNLVKWRFTCTMTVYSTQSIYPYIELWLTRQKYHQSRCRRFRVLTDTESIRKIRSTPVCAPRTGRAAPMIPGSSPNGLDWELTPGLGNHYLFLNKRIVKVSKEVETEIKGSFEGPVEQIEITTAGSSKNLITRIVNEARELANSSNRIQIFCWDGYWCSISFKQPRDLNTIYIPDEQKTRIVKKIEEFKQGQQWYNERGIPWRLGLSFEGPPGTGKTSLATALASYFKVPLYFINMASITDDDFFEAVSGVVVGGILLIEDYDCVESTSDRKSKERDKNESTARLSLSGFLNAIDGAATPDGRILIMTTNHPDKIDPAVLRKGRIDQREHLGLIGRDLVTRMFTDFYKLDQKQAAAIKAQLPIGTTFTPCDVQGILIDHKDDCNTAITMIKNSYENHQVVKLGT